MVLRNLTVVRAPPRLSLGKRLGLSAAGLGLAATGLGSLSGPGQDFLQGVSSYLHDRQGIAQVEINPEARPPPPSDHLKVITYNIEEGGRDVPAVEKFLKSEHPDVVLLQEASVATGRTLAHDLKMNSAYSGNWKIVLSRYPIEGAESKNYPVSDLERVRRAVNTWTGEPLEVRGLLDVTIRDGTQDVHVIDSHLSTQEPDWMAREYRTLGDHVATLEAAGAKVIAGGDFNSDLALAKPGRDAPGTPTDTANEYLARYRRPVGLMGDPAVQQAAARFAGEMKDGWVTSPDVSVTLHGARLTPDEAAAELAAGRGGDAQRAEDGITHLGAAGRIDGLFASPNLSPERSRVNQDLRASDHQPLVGEFGGVLNVLGG